MVCGDGLLVVTDKLHSLDGTAFTLVAHVASSGKCNYMLSTYFAQQKHCHV